jgi:hypothetical protein
LRGELTETEFSDEYWGKEPFVSPGVWLSCLSLY